MRAADLSIFRHLFASVAEEMGVTLRRTAYSPNIKERLDFSCALFLEDGQMLAQAAHIPVHLGAMPATIRLAIKRCAPFQPGDVVVVNDPYLGGTHLPDVTLISPLFFDADRLLAASDELGGQAIVQEHLALGRPQFFVATRAHHADMGGMSPGSMPLSTEIYQEGLIIPPVKLVSSGKRNEALWQTILANVRTPAEREGDLVAQLAGHTIGQQRLAQIVARYGLEECYHQARALIDYTNRLARAAIVRIPDGHYSFEDFLDGDGQEAEALPIALTAAVAGSSITFDFSRSAPAVVGNLNAVPAIVESAVVYCLRCLAMAMLDTDIPMNQGFFEPITVITRPGTILDPSRPHAVAAGNVETSQRIVDVVFGALAQAVPEMIPAASQGTMNNLTFGNRPTSPGGGPLAAPGTDADKAFAYYETMGGGVGAGPTGSGGNGMHTHMSNTRNTPIEALEYSFPVRVNEYGLRQGSGGAGLHQGGEGLVRVVQFDTPVTATLVSERRSFAPYGLSGGRQGSVGRNFLIRGGNVDLIPGKITLTLEPGDQLHLETPGGGGWGSPGEA